MFFNIILLLALDLRVYGFNYGFNGQTTTFENQVQIVDYNSMGQGSCPNIRQPLCATNGREFLFFENQCQLEVKNYEQLIQGLQEYFECPLSYCSPQCRPCELIYQPVCALDIQTQHMETFPNACEVERKTCTTQKVYSIISSGPCRQTSAGKCPQFCSQEYQPICAEFQYELKEFPNQCELEKEICLTNKDWQITDFSYCALIRGNDIIEPVSLPPTGNECPDLCSLEYKPICARFMTLEKEFSNECELKATICQTKQEWLIVRHGPCPKSRENNNLLPAVVNTKCPQFCTLEYEPVCAKFNQELKEFGNNCELAKTKCETQQDWQIVNQGPCLIKTNVPITPSCPKFCTREYEPVCAEFNSEMKEFPNQCVLFQTICETNTKWEVINLGPCVSNCPKFCTKEFKPICAEFKGQLRQFPNECELQRSKCETNIEWKILPLILCSLDSEDMESVAPEVVCATNGKINKTFKNILELQQEIKATGIAWSLLHNDDCSQPSSYNINRPTTTPTAPYKTTSTTIIPQTIYKTVKLTTTTTPSTTKPTVTSALYTATQTATPSTSKTTSTTSETTTPSITTKTTKYTTKSAPSTTTITATTAPSTTTKITKGTTTQQTTTATTSKTTTRTTYKTTKDIPETSTTQTTTIITTPRTTTMSTNEEYSARHCEEHFNCCNYESVEENDPYSEENFDYDLYDSLETINKAEEKMDTSDIIPGKPQENGQTDKAHVEEKNGENNVEKGCVIGTNKFEKYDAGYKESLNEKSYADNGKPQANGSQRSNSLVEKNSKMAVYTNTQQANLQKTLETSAGEKYNSLNQNRSETTYPPNQNIAKQAANEQPTTLDRPKYLVTYNLSENSSKVTALANENLVSFRNKPVAPQPTSATNVTALSGTPGLSNIENNSTAVFFRNEIQNSFNAKPLYTQEAIPNPITSIDNEHKEPKDHSNLINSLPEKFSDIYENLESEDSSEEYSHILQNQKSYNSEESLETDLSYELEGIQNKQYLQHGLVKEKAPKFGVYSNEAYGLDNLFDVNVNIQQDDHSIDYTLTAPVKEPESSDNILKIYEAWLSKSDSEEEDDEYLVNKVLSTLATETTSAYPIFDETKNQFNHTKREEYPAKNNATSTNKKGEIYNGVVYKAPVYDAPTYNFIYTSPYQTTYPWLMPNNQFLNYPGMPTKPQDKQTVDHKLSANVQDPNVSFNHLEFLRTLGGMPNLLPLSSATENQIKATGNDASVPPLYPFPSIPLNQVMPRTQPMPVAILSPTLSAIPNSIPLSSVPQYQSNTEIAKPQTYENGKNSKFQPSYPFSGYASPVNPQPPLNVFPYQALQPQITASEYKNSAVPSPAVTVPLTYLPNSLPSYPLNSPNSAFNSTVFNNLLEVLKNLK